jgi:hypothetical protein
VHYTILYRVHQKCPLENTGFTVLAGPLGASYRYRIVCWSPVVVSKRHPCLGAEYGNTVLRLKSSYIRTVSVVGPVRGRCRYRRVASLGGRLKEKRDKTSCCHIPCTSRRRDRERERGEERKIAKKGKEITRDKRCKTSAKTQACLPDPFGLDRKNSGSLTE